jgi:hypothetical protein
LIASTPCYRLNTRSEEHEGGTPSLASHEPINSSRRLGVGALLIVIDGGDKIGDRGPVLLSLNRGFLHDLLGCGLIEHGLTLESRALDRADDAEQPQFLLDMSRPDERHSSAIQFTSLFKVMVHVTLIPERPILSTTTFGWLET